MTRLPAHPAPSIQRGMTLIEMMIAMLLGLIVIGGVMGIFISSSETNRRTDDLARIQENARTSMLFISRSLREAGGNPCGLPPGMGLIFLDMPNNIPGSSWWLGGDDFKSSLVGYASGSGFPANGNVTMVSGSDAIISVSGSASAKTVISDEPPGGAMTIPSGDGLTKDNILFACSINKGLGVIFEAGGISKSGTNWSVARKTPFNGAVENMPVTALGKINAEGWFVGQNARGGTSLYRAFIGDNGQPEEIAQDVSSMRITYLLSKANQYVAASQIDNGSWTDVIAAYIELTITRNADSETTIQRTVGLTVNLRNRINFDESDPDENNPP